MTKYEELKKALEANLKHERHRTLAETRYWCDQYKLLAQQAIEALAQPAQEPVAMRYDYDGYGYKYIDSGSGSDWQTRIKDAEPIYAIPPAAQPAQEPVATFDVAVNDRTAAINYDHRKHKLVSGTKLYTTPPQRTWVDEAAIRADERERIKAANAPEIERINAHLKSLEDAVKAEREACAQVCESYAAANTSWTKAAVNDCATSIRARGNT